MGTIVLGLIILSVIALVFWVLCLDEEKQDAIFEIMGIVIVVAIIVFGIWAGMHGGTGTNDDHYPWDPRTR